MNSTVLSLLAAFLLSLMGLFAFMWSMRKGLLVRKPRRGFGDFYAGGNRPGRRPHADRA